MKSTVIPLHIRYSLNAFCSSGSKELHRSEVAVIKWQENGNGGEVLLNATTSSIGLAQLKKYNRKWNQVK